MPFCLREDELQGRLFCSASHFHLQLFQMWIWAGAEGVACSLCVLCVVPVMLLVVPVLLL